MITVQTYTYLIPFVSSCTPTAIPLKKRSNKQPQRRRGEREGGSSEGEGKEKREGGLAGKIERKEEDRGDELKKVGEGR